jgi:hypothetical protein
MRALPADGHALLLEIDDADQLRAPAMLMPGTRVRIRAVT